MFVQDTESQQQDDTLPDDTLPDDTLPDGWTINDIHISELVQWLYHLCLAICKLHLMIISGPSNKTWVLTFFALPQELTDGLDRDVHRFTLYNLGLIQWGGPLGFPPPL